VKLPKGIQLSGYEGEYILEKISSTKTFYEQPLLDKWFYGLETEVIYDIGANIGNHTVYFAKAAPNAQIFAFEPMPDNFAMLEKNITDNGFSKRVKAFPVAVGETKGSVSMRIMTEGNNGTATIVEMDDNSNELHTTHTVEVIAIDDLNLPSPDFIKLDVEGYELPVLKGMEKTLQNAGKVSIWIEVDTSTSEEVYEFMSGLGFDIMDVSLTQNGNVLWCNKKSLQATPSTIFHNLLEQADISRQRYLSIINTTDQLKSMTSKFKFEQEKATDLLEQCKSLSSKYEFEQGKANDLLEQCKSLTSKYEFEQDKANNLSEQHKSMTSKFKFEQNKATELLEKLKSTTSKYEYEQGKANDLLEQNKSMISKYEYEQKKANDLLAQLKSTASKYEYEQGKANDLSDQLKSTTSKFEYEQKKSTDLLEKLKSTASKFEFEQKKATDLLEQLKSMVSKYECEQDKATNLATQLDSMTSKFEYEQNKADDLLVNLKSMASKFEYEQNKATDLSEKLKSTTSKYLYEQKIVSDLKSQLYETQKELNMFRNSKMIRFMRFWVWRVPTAMRRGVRRRINRTGKWIYVKLLPFPRSRAFLSRVNGRLRIFKNPQEIAAANPTPLITQQPEQNIQIVQSVAQLGKTQTIPKSAKLPSKMNVAMIVDEFTYNSFRFECNALPLEPENWQEIFNNNDIDFFFCESAWAGVDSLKRPWRGKIYASVNFTNENRGILLEILDYCKKNNIPTIFWNKEDPTHYEDRIHDFVKTALNFDHIFTTAIECVEHYKNDYGHPSVHLLMFATQPQLFNPIESFNRTNEIIFAGSWYAQHPSRSEEMSSVFDSILQSQHELKIFNRHSENDDPNHAFPEKYLPYVNPRLSHDQLEIAYKGSKYALNFNTVTESKTMFARRAFELMSSNTLVISNYSQGLEYLFGANIIFTDGTNPIDLSQHESKRDYCLYTVLQHHTYKHRFEQILRDVGISYLESIPQVEFRYNVSCIETASLAAKHFYSMDWGNKNCIFYVDRCCSPKELQEIVCRFNAGLIVVRSQHYDSTYQHSISSDTVSDYVITANTELSHNFLRKAFAHIVYLDKDVAIMSGDAKYSFKDLTQDINMLLPKICSSNEIIRAYII